MSCVLKRLGPWFALSLVLLPVATVDADSLSVRVGHVDDDAEERVSDGVMYLDSTDVELIHDEFEGDQIIGLRFLNINIPSGATINSAYIDFTTDETANVATSVVFRGEDASNPARYTAAVDDISDRPTTVTSVSWDNIPAWNTVGEVHTTPDLGPIVQSSLDRGDWSSGNAMAFIVTGSGTRVAESYDGSPTEAPLLRIDYTPRRLIEKRAFQVDGAPLPSGSTVPAGVSVKFMLYIDNPGASIADVSVRDSLDPVFEYVPGSIRYDNSVVNCASETCTSIEEAAIFAAVDSAQSRTDAVDTDAVSFAGVTLEAGNENAANAQLDIAGGRVWAVVLTVKMR